VTLSFKARYEVMQVLEKRRMLFSFLKKKGNVDIHPRLYTTNKKIYRDSVKVLQHTFKILDK
jgi:hypothetical protein